MIYVLLGSIVVSFLAGSWVGKKLTVRRFHRLQDEGELVVMTADQYRNSNQIRSLLREGEGGEGDDEEPPYQAVTYERRDAEARRDDWAIRMKKGTGGGP